MPEPVELLMELRPPARFDVIDVRRAAVEREPCLANYPQPRYSSIHTTAGADARERTVDVTVMRLT